MNIYVYIFLQIQWESKEQHILKCKIGNEIEVNNTWDSFNPNHKTEIEQKIEHLMNVVKYLYFSFL